MRRLSHRFGSADMEWELDGSHSVRFAYWDPDHARDHSFGAFSSFNRYCGTEHNVFSKEETDEAVNSEYLTVEEAWKMLAQLGLAR